MAETFILALDQGTTSSRAVLFDAQARIRGMAQREFEQHFPQAGWVEHEPEDLWNTQLHVAREVLQKAGISPGQIKGIGITNQRETTVVWDRHSGKAVHRAIVWQDRRTAALCEQWKSEGLEDFFRERTGLVLDAYFSGSKLRWILDQVPGARQSAERGDLLFGTVDTWLIWRLSAGRVHATDPSNASRTLMYDLHRGQWSEELCRALDVPINMLPEIRDSSGDFGSTAIEWFEGHSIPICGVAGDQQAALFGQACFQNGMAKNTYGTGCFMLMNTGSEPVASKSGLLSTVAWQMEGQRSYALEGSVFIGGAVIQWLRDGLGLIESASDSEKLASSVDDNGGLVMVPAFTGLGAPHWDMYARGAIFGITRGTSKGHMLRAALESIAFQSRDVLDAMSVDAGSALRQLRVDGGAAANDLLMQFQADILGIPVSRPLQLESTAQGAAFLAGIALSFYRKSDLSKLIEGENARIFEPDMAAEKREQHYRVWQEAVRRCSGWIAPR